MKTCDIKRKSVCTAGLFAALLLLVCLSGCTKKYEREDIEEYVSANICLEDFTVSEKYRIRTEEDGYEDKIWTVLDNRTGLVFHVIDDFSWTMEWVSNSLEHDYDAAVLHFVENQLPEFTMLSLDLEQEEGLYYAEINGGFANEEELRECWSELYQLRSDIRGAGYQDLSVFFRLAYLHPLRDAAGNERRQGDGWGWMDDHLDLREMIHRYVRMALEYRYDGTYEDFPQELVRQALEGDDNMVGIYRSTDSVVPEYYEDIVASPNYYGISFGSLYEILKREGFSPEGTPNHYRFTGTGGTVYEISYDFDDYVFESDMGDAAVGYYYLKDGAQVPMDTSYYNHFEVDEIQEMTGLRLVDQIEEK